MAICVWCGKKLGFLEGSAMSYGMLCNECGSLRERAKDADKGAITILTKYLEEVSSNEAKEDIERIIESTKDLILRRENAEKEKEREYQKEIRYKEEMEKISEKVKHILMNTGYNFEGYNIVRYCGIVSAETVLGTGMLSEWSLSLNDFLGTTSEIYQSKLAMAKQSAQDKLKIIAATQGANAIIGIDFDILTLANNAIVVSVNGTAVLIEKKN